MNREAAARRYGGGTLVSLGALGSITLGEKDAPFCACKHSPWYTCRAAVEGTMGTGGSVKFYLSKCAVAWYTYMAAALVALIFIVGVKSI